MDFSYIRETFNKGLFNQYVLSIQLDPDGFSFYVADKDSIHEPLYFLLKSFEKSGVETLIRELKDFNHYDGQIFYKTLIVYHTNKFCLVPDNIYDQDFQSDYLRLSHPLTADDIIHSSGIQKIKSKVLFCLPEELNTLINAKFPEAIILHSSCPALNFGILKSEKACIINGYETSISLAVFDRTDLKLFNVFSVRDENDIIYHLLNSLKHCNQKVADTNIYFSGRSNMDPENNILQSKYISNPVFYQPDLKIEGATEFPVNMLFNHLEGMNCVL